MPETAPHPSLSLDVREALSRVMRVRSSALSPYVNERGRQLTNAEAMEALLSLQRDGHARLRLVAAQEVTRPG